MHLSLTDYITAIYRAAVKFAYRLLQLNNTVHSYPVYPTVWVLFLWQTNIDNNLPAEQLRIYKINLLNA